MRGGPGLAGLDGSVPGYVVHGSFVCVCVCGSGSGSGSGTVVREVAMWHECFPVLSHSEEHEGAAHFAGTGTACVVLLCHVVRQAEHAMQRASRLAGWLLPAFQRARAAAR